MIIAGLLLPSSMLDSTWFRVFSLFVAINTLMYLGLTLSKFVPWPKQMHPRQVRRLLAADGTSTTPDDRTSEPITGRAGADPYTVARLSVAARSVYRALGLLGIQVVAVNLAQLAVFPDVSLTLCVISMAFGVTAILLSITLGRHRERPELAIWIWALLAAAFVVVQCVHSIGDRIPLDIADAVIVLVLIPPIALSWPASLTSSSICASAIMAAAIIDQGTDSLASVFTIASATAGGLIIMHLRTTAIDEATAANLALRRHPTTDPMTGVLSLPALRTLSPDLFTIGTRASMPVHLLRIRIEDLEGLRIDYGNLYVSVLLSSVARALTTISGPGELVARSDEDEFSVLGLGAVDPEEFHAKVLAQLATSPVDLGKRATRTTVSVLHDADAAALLSPIDDRPDR